MKDQARAAGPQTRIAAALDRMTPSVKSLTAWATDNGGDTVSVTRDDMRDLLAENTTLRGLLAAAQPLLILGFHNAIGDAEGTKLHGDTLDAISAALGQPSRNQKEPS